VWGVGGGGGGGGGGGCLGGGWVAEVGVGGEGGGGGREEDDILAWSSPTTSFQGMGKGDLKKGGEKKGKKESRDP